MCTPVFKDWGRFAAFRKDWGSQTPAWLVKHVRSHICPISGLIFDLSSDSDSPDP
jgi:hypothetical protein